MSPEQFLDGDVTNQSDLFSLGNVLYELLTGTLPFAAQTLAGVIHRVLRVAPPPLCDHRPDAPVAMQQIIDRALARDPAERFDTAIDFAAALSVAFSDAANETSDLVLDSREEKLKSSAFFCGLQRCRNLGAAAVGYLGGVCDRRHPHRGRRRGR